MNMVFCMKNNLFIKILNNNQKKLKLLEIPFLKKINTISKNKTIKVLRFIKP